MGRLPGLGEVGEAHRIVRTSRYQSRRPLARVTGKRTRRWEGTLLLLFRRGGPRAAQWIWTYGTQEVQAKCVPRLGSGRAFDATLCITCSPLFASSLTKQSVNVSECHHRHQCKPLITMAFARAIAPAGIAGGSVRPYVRGATFYCTPWRGRMRSVVSSNLPEHPLPQLPYRCQQPLQF